MAKKRSEGCEIDMTPMIDVVFQLIIFFIVTIQMEKNYREDIELEMGPHSPEIKAKDINRTMVIEVDKKGYVYIQSARLGGSNYKSPKARINHLRGLIRRRYANFGEFPVLIRGDKDTPHKYIRDVMDACAAENIWRINFAAIKERRR